MLRTLRTVDELVTIYQYAQDGVSYAKIAQRIGVDQPSVVSALRSLERYLDGTFRSQKRKFHVYIKAAREIRKLRRDTRQAPPQQTTNLATLKHCFQALEGQVVMYVKQELENRYSQLQEENKALREEVERLKNQGGTINWLDSLEDTRKENQ